MIKSLLWLGALVLCVGTLAAAADLRLIEAAKNQDREAALALLKQKVDVNAAQADGATALHWAAHWDDVPLAEALVRAGASVNAANDLGVTPLALACSNGGSEMVKRLLQAGADPNVVAAGEPVLMTAAHAGNADAVSALIARGATVNATDSVRGQTALMWAVAHSHPDVVRVLIEHGANIHARSRIDQVVVQRGNRYGGVVSQQRAVTERAVVTTPQGGSTPLLFAARSGDVASARLLVAAGADANETAPDGTSALVMASHSGHGPLAALLMEHGADPNAAGSGYSALHAAVLQGDLDLVTALVAHKAEVNQRVTVGTPSRRYSKDLAMNAAWIGATPLWLAARFAEPEIVRFLAAHGADALLTSKDETTPLIAVVAAGVDWGPSASDSRDRRLDPEDLARRATERDALEKRVLQVVELAVALGIDVNARNYVGDTALHQAAAKGFNTVIQYLVSQGAGIDLRNKRGQTPLSITEADAKSGDGRPSLKSTAELLRKLGAT